ENDLEQNILSPKKHLLLVAEREIKSAFRPTLFTNYKLKCGMKTIRTVIPHLYGWKSAKWINGLEFLDYEKLGLWENNGYHRRGDPWLHQRYDA
ncbi:MAG: molybdopterin-dependent oxidoreductase, partial [Waterburya sp.]